MDRAPQPHRGFVIGLLLLGVAARFAPHAPNVTPLTALALFGGRYLERRWGILLPLACVALSDLWLGLHDTIAFTWGSFALIGVLGWWIRKRPGMPRMVAASLLGSTIFFLVTNLGVWWLGDGGRMYPHTLDGLKQCYVAALPFYRNALAGDLVYTLAIFGVYAVAAGRLVLPSAGRTR